MDIRTSSQLDGQWAQLQPLRTVAASDLRAGTAHRPAIVVTVKLADVGLLGAQDHYLAVVATPRADGSVQASVVNAGILGHPVSGVEVVAFVTYGQAKLANLRARRRATVVFRAGWQWASVEGRAEMIGPDDPYPGFDPAALPELLRSIFRAAGGTHDDWRTFDRVMGEERRCAVLVHPERIYSNPSS
jgi:PPOX class probable F420-dependent enzyme